MRTGVTLLPATLALLLFLLRPVPTASSLVRRIARWWPARTARIFPALGRQLGHLFFERCDTCVLLGDPPVLRRELGLEPCDPIVSPFALHAVSHRRFSARSKASRNNGSRWITYAAARAGVTIVPHPGLNGYGRRKPGSVRAEADFAWVELEAVECAVEEGLVDDQGERAEDERHLERENSE
jgi:hypothetical protein